MELRHLRYFVATAETLNMRQAADALRVAQPSLSVQIKDLETQLGVALFHRNKNRLSLTEAGTVFLEKAKDILADSTRAVKDARLAAQGQIGELRIRFISSAVTGVLQNTVAAYRARFPLVRLDLLQSISDVILDDLRNGKSDIAFVRTALGEDNDLVRAAYYPESYMVALPSDHALAKRKKLGAKDLVGIPLIQYPRKTARAPFDHLLSLLSVDGRMPTIAIEAPEQMTIAGLVAAGLGYSVVPECMARIGVPGVAHVPLIGGEKATGIAVVHRKDADALVRGFVSVL